jgi:hypothetical protein
MLMQTTLSPRVHRLSVAALVALTTMAGTAGAAIPVLADDVEAGCFTRQPGTVGAIDHPTDPGAVVLRMSVGGGFVPYEVAFIEQNPVFTLYGNDTAIFQPATNQESITDPWAPYQCVRLSSEQVDELLQFTLEEGGLADADELYPHPFIVDTPTTTFTIDADGVDKVVNIQALGFDEAPDAEARAGFSALADLLSHFDAEVDGEEPYDVTQYEALLTPWWAENVPEPVDWPWTELTLEDFEGDEYARYGMLAAEQAGEVVEVPNGGQIMVPVATPDGELLSLSVRPILPGEMVDADE